MNSKRTQMNRWMKQGSNAEYENEVQKEIEILEKAEMVLKIKFSVSNGKLSRSLASDKDIRAWRQS